MTLHVDLISEDFDVVRTIADDFGLDTYISHFRNSGYELLRFLDPYGDTIFNREQRLPLKAELERFRDSLNSGQDELRLWLDRVVGLVNECHALVHHYVRFRGM